MKIKISKILCPTDFSEHSEYALKYALEIAILTKAELQLLHVVEPIEYPQPTQLFEPMIDEVKFTMQMQEVFQERLDDLVSSLKNDYPEVSGKLVTGNAFLEIIKAARDGGIELIIMGTHGRSGLAHVLIGSVAEKVVREASCPVLTVKHPEQKFIKA